MGFIVWSLGVSEYDCSSVTCLPTTHVCVLASVHHLFSRNAVIAKLFDINYG